MLSRTATAARMVEAHEARHNGGQGLLYVFRHLVGMGLPIKRPPLSQLQHRRRDRSATFTLVGAPDHGVPWGQDRLTLIWLVSAFHALGCPADRRIRFAQATAIRRAFGDYDHGGKTMGRLRASLQRLFFATWFFERQQADGTEERQRLQLMTSIRMRFLGEKPSGLPWQWSQMIELDPMFAAMLRERGAMPIDLQTVRALRGEPATLDLYCFEVWRSWRLAVKQRRPVTIPIFGGGGLLDQFSMSQKNPRSARQLLRRHQARIRAVWPDCPNHLDATCDSLTIYPAVAVRAIDTTRCILPGVEPPPDEVIQREHELEALRATSADLMLDRSQDPRPS